MKKPKHAIRVLREKARKTRRQLAAAVGITESAVYLWECGSSVPSGKNLVRALDYFRRELERPDLQASDLLLMEVR